MEKHMTNKRWIYYPKKTENIQAAEALTRELSIPPVIARILVNRGIDTAQKASSYLSKGIGAVHHPFELKDAKKAALRIKQAIESGEKTVIYGDYDVDGITSTAIMYRFLREHGADVDYYIPNRSDEGYGINMLALQKIKSSGASLLITVDCGITAVGEVEFAKSLGLDVIITDHHTCKEELPRAYALVNPKQSDCTYPFKDLAGVGVAFKLILATALVLEEPARKYFDKYIETVAVGTVADVVSLTDENRIFVANGLRNIHNTKTPGLQALFGEAGISGKPVNTGTISFAVAPRINAAGRVGSANTAVELLVTDSAERAAEIAAALDGENKQRQKTENQILQEALEMIAQIKNPAEKHVLVLAKKDWHHGVIGIVASRIVDRFNKPTILISLKDNLGKGSGRSIKGFNLFDALTHCSDILLKYGGHDLAAGLGLNYSDIDEFDRKINEYAAEVLKTADTTPSITIDAELEANEITFALAEALSVFEPFGMGNPQPVFSITGATLLAERTMSDGKHCKLSVSKNGKAFNFIGFGMGALTEHFVIGNKIDIAFTAGINVFRDEQNLQLVIKAARASIH